MLPEPGTNVMFGRTAYVVVRHGCATSLRNCMNGDNAITVKQLRWNRRHQTYEVYIDSTICLDGSRCHPLEEQ